MLKKLMTSAAMLLVAALQPLCAQETRQVTDDLGRTVDVPLHPERVASLHDTSITVALLELGVIPVGSHGRTTNEGDAHIRSGKLMSGMDFDNSDIAFLGNSPADIEKVAAVKPDLILTTTWQNADVDQLAAIAPTYVFDLGKSDDFEIYAKIAELIGKEDVLKYLDARYQSQLQQIRDTVDVENTKVAIIQGYKGELLVWNTYGSLGKVLRDAGFEFPEIVNNISGGERQSFSGEYLPQFDADIIFITYRPQRGETPQSAADEMAKILPSWCDALTACKNGNIVYLPRSETTAATYDSLGMMAYTIIGQTAGRSAPQSQ
ncbi:ABC transporter substrate-binding protein [Cardiobacteriaceae bacterium TAE3-ERU3]|nr:ABC transporter substrate-binding protein [Cardiobacteriaceae bacterium TAE3-ERU3]